MKRFLCAILSAVLLLTGFVFSNAAEKGDIDGDGAITAADARLALRKSVGLEEFNEEQNICADFDGDGNISAGDARAILRLSVGLPVDEEPIEPNDPEEPEIPEVPEVHVPSAKELKFYETLYETAHPFLGQHKVMFDNPILKNFQKWCCLYTVGDVFRPALEKAGYTQAQIDLLAPNTFSKDSLAKAISNILGTKWPTWLTIDFPLYVPSLLADYYIKTPEAADTYFMYDFYDDIVESKVYEHKDADRKSYEPRVGDVLFMSNKTRTYENGYPTVDHTAQIIKVYDDGTFLCTEGSIIESQEGDDLARVRERRYRYNEKLGTYEFVNNPIVIVLFVAQPKFS